MAKKGNIVSRAEPGLSDPQLLELFRLMLLTRVLDSKILSIQRQGRIGPYVPCFGEEAAMVASAFAMEKEDWMISSYRELGAHLTRGLSIDLALAQLFGNSNDLLKGRQMSNSWGSKLLHNVPTAAPIGAYLPMAVGIAMAGKLKKENFCVLSYFGDGATSAADFHTAMNFAGVYKAPIVFFCRNNGWAISLPVDRQTASENLSLKASAYGFDGIRINGNDALAVYAATRKALQKSREGGGPSMIEAVTYRVGPHSTADDPSRYRGTEKASVEDPLKLLREMLVKKQVWSVEEEEKVTATMELAISQSIARQEQTLPLSPQELLFEDVYSKLPDFLREQQVAAGEN